MTSASDTSQYSTLLPPAVGAGKKYEAFILAKVAEQLVAQEGMNLTLSNGNKIALKRSHGPINRRYPRIDAKRSGMTVAELWTDVEFLSWSYWKRPKTRPLTHGEYHELDIVMVDPGVDRRPSPDEIWLGVECKNHHRLRERLTKRDPRNSKRVEFASTRGGAHTVFPLAASLVEGRPAVLPSGLLH